MRSIGEGSAGEEGAQAVHLLVPADDGGQSGAGQGQILRHGHGRHQGEVLEDHADAAAPRLARIARAPGGAVHQHLAFVDAVDAHDALGERALACSVFADEGVKLAGLDAEIDAVQRLHGAEALANAAHLPRRAASCIPPERAGRAGNAAVSRAGRHHQHQGQQVRRRVEEMVVAAIVRPPAAMDRAPVRHRRAARPPCSAADSSGRR